MALTRSSTEPVETPWTYASCTTVVSALALRRKADSREESIRCADAHLRGPPTLAAVLGETAAFVVEANRVGAG